MQIAAAVNKQPFMVMVPVASPHQTLAELTAAMKQKGDKASYAQSNTSGKVMGDEPVVLTVIDQTPPGVANVIQK